jgi:hypothetical protein
MRIGDLTTLANANGWLGLTGLNILAASQAAVCVLTLAAQPSTPLISGLRYEIAGATGMVELNGEWTITVLTPTTFSIPLDSTLLLAYTGGAYVGVTQPLVERLISATSAYIQNYISRMVASTTYLQTFNGQAMPTMVLPQWPVTSISLLQADGLTIEARAPLVTPSVYNNGFGYTFQPPGQVALTGYLFPRGYNNVTVEWVGGYLIEDEAHTVPDVPGPYVVETSGRWSAGDRGVTYASTGVALVAVTATPTAAGEYRVDTDNWSLYEFSELDAGADVLISYAFVPYDIEQACIDMMGDWFVYRSRIGVLSKGIEGQTITYTNTPITSRARGVLDQYRRVI